MNIEYKTDIDGFIVVPELTDAKLLGLNIGIDSLSLVVEVIAGATRMTYQILCGGLVTVRIDKFSDVNISMDFFASTDSIKRRGLLNDDLIRSLFSGKNGAYPISKEAAIQQITDNTLILFGNEPSCGCEIAVICKELKVSSS